MFRRPKVQFKPKIQALGERKQQSPVKLVPDAPILTESPCEQAVVPEKEVDESCGPQVIDPSAECFDGEAVIIQNGYELQTITTSHVPLNCLNGDSYEPGDNLTTQEVLIETSDVFAVPHPVAVQPQQQTAGIRPVPVVVETRKAVTIRAKETAAALTVSGSADGAAHHSDSRDKRQPRKPKICLSSNRIRLPIDKSKVTMFDLLSYNPPMSDEQKERRRKADEDAELLSHKSSSGSPSKSATVTSAASVSSSSPAKDDQSKGSSAGPRVKIGVNGEIVIDEESLIVNKKMDVVTDTVYEGSDPANSQVTYASFRNKNRSSRKSRWSDEETVKFYKALSAVGTDFSLMSKVFFNGSRNRLDLRNKYKKEEKLNQHLIDRALENTDLSLLDEIDLQLAGSEENPDDQNLQPVPTADPVIEAPQSDSNEDSETAEVIPKVRSRRRGRASVDSDDVFTPQKVRRNGISADVPVTRRSTRLRK